MKILIIVHSFPPEIRSASHLFFDLAESLTRKGHKVTVITRLPKYNVSELEDKYRKRILLKEKQEEIDVLRIVSPSFPRNLPWVRAIEQFLLAFLFLIGGIFLKKRDVTLVYSPPLPLGLTAYFLKLFKKTPFIFNVQDIYPQAAIDLGLLRNHFLIKISKSLEEFIYKKASFITVHSQGNLEHLLLDNPALSGKIRVIPNWVDTNLIKPGRKINQFRKDYNFKNNFLISFAGVMGFAQDLEVVIEAAKSLKDYKDIKFVLVGDGPAKKKLQELARSLELENIKFLPMQPREVYLQILSASDICLVTLKKEVKTPVVPGKIMSIMAAARPIIASLPLRGDAAKLIKEAQAGLLAEPGNPESLAKAVLELYRDKEKRKKFGDNARRYAEKNLSREVCVQKYEDLFLQIGKNVLI